MRSWIRHHPLGFSVIGVLLAIASTTVLDAVGFGLNVLPLIPLFFLFWYLQRLSRPEIGLTWGRRGDYTLAIFYPALVLALVGLIAWVSGAVTLSAINWSSTLLNLAGQILFTSVFAIVTEEGVFRGWLSGPRSDAPASHSSEYSYGLVQRLPPGTCQPRSYLPRFIPRWHKCLFTS